MSAIRKPDAELLRGDTEIFAIDSRAARVKALTDRAVQTKTRSVARWPVDRLHRNDEQKLPVTCRTCI